MVDNCLYSRFNIDSSNEEVDTGWSGRSSVHGDISEAGRIGCLSGFSGRRRCRADGGRLGCDSQVGDVVWEESEDDSCGVRGWGRGTPFWAALAQWLEHRSYTPGVPSSNLGCGRSVERGGRAGSAVTRDGRSSGLFFLSSSVRPVPTAPSWWLAV